MKLNTREIQLGAAGLGYIRDCLAEGKELSKSLLERLDLERGRVTTFLPIETTDERATEFRWGGKVPFGLGIQSGDGIGHLPSRIPNMNAALTNVVEAYLKSSDEAACVVEDPLAEPSDGALSRSPVKPSFCGQSVLYVLTAVHADPRLIEKTLRIASSISPPMVGALTRHRGRADNTLDLQELREIAAHTERVVMSAYDGEGFVMWSKG
jgi:hypothetical protein